VRPVRTVLFSLKENVMDATGVIIAGYNVNEEPEHWQNVVWGNPPHQLGRVPKGIAVALRERAGLLIFGGGGSRHEMSGEVEARHTIAYLYNHWKDLYKFSAFQGSGCRRALDLLKQGFKSTVIPEVKSENTEQEVRNALQLCIEHRLTRAVFVSSADHICRCYQKALASVSENGSGHSQPRLMVSAEAADTMYSSEGIEGVLVKERHDQHCSLW
jgi:hypothetical protein